MNPKIGGLLVLILIIAIVLIGLFNLPILDAGYRVNIHGTVYDATGAPWGVTYNSYTTSKDNLMPFWYWQDKIDVYAFLDDGMGHIYTGTDTLEDYNPVYYQESFTCSIRWVPSGTYTGSIDVYHVVYDDMTGFFEQSRDLVASTSIPEITVP